MNLLQRIKHLEAAQKRKEKVAGKYDDSHIGEATKKFFRKLRGIDGDTTDNDLFEESLNAPKRNDEGISEEVIRFLEAIKNPDVLLDSSEPTP